VTKIKLLEDGIKKLGLIPDTIKVNQLITYIELLLKWNKVYSLTAITNTQDIITHHMLDGLTVVPYINSYHKIIDVGSGMGVPGVIIAIWYPEHHVTALDSNSKKTAFLQQVTIELGLNNLHVVTSRVESYIPETKFDMVISRAFADTNRFMNLTKHLLCQNGIFMAMKSEKAMDELNKLPKQYKYDCIDLEMPGIADKRVLVKIENI
jgi:16S rRNA (guanine527-N7)-methyltransferase